ncbi:MAG: hypothetical protein ACI85I_001821, partial [Arenicella sp.]
MHHFKLNFLGRHFFGFTFLLLISFFMVHSQTIPTDRKIDWSVSGLINLPKTKMAEVSIDGFGAKADGVSDDSQAIQKVLNSLKSSGGVIRLNAGKYLLAKGISIPSNVTLRGKSASETHLVFNSGNTIVDFVNFKGRAPKTFISLQKAPEKGD